MDTIFYPNSNIVYGKIGEIKGLAQSEMKEATKFLSSYLCEWAYVVFRDENNDIYAQVYFDRPTYYKKDICARVYETCIEEDRIMGTYDSLARMDTYQRHLSIIDKYRTSSDAQGYINDLVEEREQILEEREAERDRRRANGEDDDDDDMSSLSFNEDLEVTTDDLLKREDFVEGAYNYINEITRYQFEVVSTRITDVSILMRIFVDFIVFVSKQEPRPPFVSPY